MSQLKPGDSAVIVHSRVAENIGRTVEIVAGAPGGIVEMPDGRQEYGEFKGDPLWIVSATRLARINALGELTVADCAVFSQNRLMSLRGDFKPETVSEQETQHA